MPTFMQRYSATPLGEIFADQSPVSVFSPSLEWMNLPDAQFLEYAEHAAPAPYDLEVNDPKQFHPGATFLLAQAHRIWLTLKMVERHLPAHSGGLLLDLGAYPFTIDVAIRRLLKRDQQIIATYAQALSEESVRALKAERIELIPVNLDPRVIVEPRLDGMTDSLPLENESVDMVLFAHVIEHLYHPIQLLREVFRVLKPGGKIVLTTDHGFLLGGLLNYLNGGEYVHEPVETTAAMVFHEWRGHVRFFTEGDLRKLLECAGGRVVECRLHEVLYNSVPERYFVQPNVAIPGWRATLLTEFPALRNEILMVAEKPRRAVFNPFDVRAQAGEFQTLSEEFVAGELRKDRPTLQDLAFGARLLFGRWPTREEIAQFNVSPPNRGLDGLVDSLLASPEFAVRPLAVSLERPGKSCIIMTETKSGQRFFFSAQDTFVGFPVAVGVYERDVCDVLARLLLKGMICIDIGANFGFCSVTMAGAVGKEGRVYAFEPEAFNYSLLLKNRTENGMEETISTFNVACSDDNGEVNLHRHANPANFAGWYVPGPGEAELGGEFIRVPACRADSLIPAGERIDLVRIDVEGFELHVLRGITGLFESHRPVLICRFHSDALKRHGPDTPSELLAGIAAAGYVAHDASRFAKGEIVPFTYDSSVSCYTNLVCIPNGYKSIS